MTDLTVLAPVSGAVTKLADVGDGVFSAGILGSGSAITATDSRIAAPLSGEVTTAMPHAYGIRSADGTEVLVHIGIDTVELEGRNFISHVGVGDIVSAGDPLADVDFPGITAAGYRTPVIIIVTNTPAFSSVVPTDQLDAAAGDVLLTLAH